MTHFHFPFIHHPHYYSHPILILTYPHHAAGHALPPLIDKCVLACWDGMDASRGRPARRRVPLTEELDKTGLSTVPETDSVHRERQPPLASPPARELGQGKGRLLLPASAGPSRESGWCGGAWWRRRRRQQQQTLPLKGPSRLESVYIPLLLLMSGILIGSFVYITIDRETRENKEQRACPFCPQYLVMRFPARP